MMPVLAQVHNFFSMKTPQQSFPKLARALAVPDLYLKREDLHKYGSHKGRSIPLMVKTYAKDGWKEFVISSSGNAALAAVLSVEQHNKNNPNQRINLRICIGKNIDAQKLQTLTKTADKAGSAVRIEQTERPKQTAFLLDKKGEAKYLRQSTDDLALEGYRDLAQEVLKIPGLAAVFIPTSSGTTAQALGEAFLSAGSAAQIHIVQTTACHAMAKKYDADFTPASSSRAGAIVDGIAHRKSRVWDVIEKTRGNGWVVNDEQILRAQALLKEHAGIHATANGALAVAGIEKAVKHEASWDGPVVALICGA